MPGIRNWSWEILVFIIYATHVGVQLFMTPIVGMADNGDFPKVLGHYDICAPQEYQYVSERFKIDPQCRWDIHVVSSEGAFVQILKQVATWNRDYDVSVQSQGKA